MALLADAVLPLIRTRADLHRWSASNTHGRQMHEAVDVLEAAIPGKDPSQVYAVTHKALVSAVKVSARADDSSGIIGDACRRLLALHPRAAAQARALAGRLVDWMIAFQFDGDVDYFELDPVAYVPALGENGVAAYRAKLDERRARLTPQAPPSPSWSLPDGHERWVLEWNDRRLAVLDHDIEAIIRTHAKDRKVAAWFQDTAEAFEEIGEMALASLRREAVARPLTIHLPVSGPERRLAIHAPGVRLVPGGDVFADDVGCVVPAPRRLAGGAWPPSTTTITGSMSGPAVGEVAG